MSNRMARATFRCDDDCVMSGCPSHEAVLTLQSTSMAYHFTTNGPCPRDWHFSPAELAVLLELVEQITYGGFEWGRKRQEGSR